jgi:general secretion pathway protein A
MASVPVETLITPFSSSPDPTVVHITTGWKSTAYKTRYAIEHRQGLAAILGDPGLGKSTLLRWLFAHFSALPNVVCTFIPTPAFKSDFAMLKKICDDFGIERERSMLAQQETFEKWLNGQYERGFNVVIFLDEAQKLDASQLELVRSMLNYETDREKLIQMVLAGNLGLRDRLLLKRNKPLASRIFAPSLVNTMTLEEIVSVLRVRCERESIGWPFDDNAIKAIYEFSGGVPRLALKTAELSYAQARELGMPRVTEEIAAAVIEEFRIDGTED